MINTNPDRNGGRPSSLTTVGNVWILIGLVGVLEHAAQTQRLQMPDSYWFLVLAGVGLLKCWRLARWYLLVMTGICFVGGLITLPMLLLKPDEWIYRFPLELAREQRPHENMSLVLGLTVVMGYLFLSGWTFKVLSRSNVKACFARSSAVVRHAMSM